MDTSILWSHHEETMELTAEILQGTMPGACKRKNPRTTRMDKIKTCTGLPSGRVIRMAESRAKCRKYVHGVANPRIEDS